MHSEKACSKSDNEILVLLLTECQAMKISIRV